MFSSLILLLVAAQAEHSLVEAPRDPEHGPSQSLLSDEALPPAALSGSYGMLLRVPVKSSFPVVGEVEAVYESLHLVKIEPGGEGKLVQRERICTVRIDEDLALFELHISPRAVSSLPEARADATLSEKDGRLQYAVTLPKRYLGMRQDAARLPTSSDDGDVRDTDGDGQPGLTLALSTPVGGVDVYIVQRDQAALSGEVKGRSLVEGKVQVLRLEQRVIGTKPSFTEKLDLSMAPRENARFSLFRVPEDASCDDLATRWAVHLGDARRLAALEQEGGGGFPEESWAAP